MGLDRAQKSPQMHQHIKALSAQEERFGLNISLIEEMGDVHQCKAGQMSVCQDLNRDSQSRLNTKG